MIAFAIYLAWALVATWPLVLHLGTAMPGPGPGDQSFYVWATDTVLTEIAAGRLPWHSDRIFVPLGVNLTEQSTGFALAVLAAPFWAWGGTDGIVLFYGLLVIGGVALAAVGMRGLVYELTQDRWAAFWAGLLYASAPAFFSFVQSTHWQRMAGGVALPWVLWACCAWLRAARGGGIAFSLGLWFLVLTDYYVTGMALVACAVLLVLAWRWSRWRAAMTLLAANLLVAAGLWVTLPPRAPLSGGAFWYAANANLADYFMPGFDVGRTMVGVFGSHLRWAGALAPWGPRFDGGADPDSYYVGFGPALLALLALRRGSRSVYALAVAAVLLALLACGAVVRWGETTLLLHETPWVRLMQLVPIFRNYDCPRPFALAATTCLVAVAGVGLARLPRRLLPLVAVAIFVVEYAAVGIPLSMIDMPRVYRMLGHDGRTLLELPRGIVESKGGLGWGGANSLGMAWQTLHRHPTVGGYVSRVPQPTFTWYTREPIIRELLLMTSEWGHVFQDPATKEWHEATHLGTYSIDQVRAFLLRFHLGYILLSPNERQPLFRREIERVFAEWLRERIEVDGFTLYVLREP